MNYCKLFKRLLNFENIQIGTSNSQEDRDPPTLNIAGYFANPPPRSSSSSQPHPADLREWPPEWRAPRPLGSSG